MKSQALSAKPHRDRRCTLCRGSPPRARFRRQPRACTSPLPPCSPVPPHPPPCRDCSRGCTSLAATQPRRPSRATPRLARAHSSRGEYTRAHPSVPLPRRLLQKRRALLRQGLATANDLFVIQTDKGPHSHLNVVLVSDRKVCSATCRPCIRRWRSAGRAKSSGSRSPIRIAH